MRKKDVETLVEVGDVAGLRAALDDKHMRVRFAAIVGLREIGSAAAADALVEHALHTGYLTTQGEAAKALEALGDNRTVEAYMATVRDGWGHDVKSDVYKAADRLVELADGSVVAPLQEVLWANGGRSGPWEQACRVLARVGGDAVASTLLWVATGDPLPNMTAEAVAATRAAAVEGLEAMTGVDVEGFAVIDVERLAAVAALGLRSEDELTKRLSETAISALGARHDDAARSALISLRNTELADTPTDTLPPAIAAALEDASWADTGARLSGVEQAAPAPTLVHLGESPITWGAAPPSGGSDERRVSLLGGDRFRPGQFVSFTFGADRWPDPKVTGVEVEVAYLSSFVQEWVAQPQTLGGQLFAPLGVQTRESSSSGEPPDRTVVARGAIEPTALDPSGRITGTFPLPDPCPPTVADFSRWVIDVHVHRRHGLDKHPATQVIVLTSPTDQVIAARPPAAMHSTDWLHHIVGHDLGPARSRQAAWINGPVSAAAGDVLVGTVTVRPDVDSVARLRRKTQKQAQETGMVTLPGLTVALECWRGSPARDAFQRMWVAKRPIVDDLTVALDQAREVPFEIELPASIPLAPTSAQQTRPAATPPTFFGSTFEAPDLDDVRWRLVTGLRTSSDEDQGPFWAATEVLVTSPSS